jgi:hypothetical protein
LIEYEPKSKVSAGTRLKLSRVNHPSHCVEQDSRLEAMRATVRELVGAADVVVVRVREETDDRTCRERFDDRPQGSDADARIDQ